MIPTTPPTILYAGNDPSLGYLLSRYAERGGCRLESIGASPPDLSAARPLAVWFSSLEVLETSQALRAAAAGVEIPMVVCASVLDEARAFELGADYCAAHPLTYKTFLTALAALGVDAAERRLQALPADHPSES